MTDKRKEFDKWFTDKYEFNQKKYRTVIGNKTKVRELLSDFYLLVVEKEKYNQINCYDSYLSTYIFNTTSNFKVDKIKNGGNYQVFTKHFKILNESAVGNKESKGYELANNDKDPSISNQYTAYNTHSDIEEVDYLSILREVADKVLNLYERELYFLILEKGYNISKIAVACNYNRTQLYQIITPMKVKLKDGVIKHLIENEILPTDKIQELIDKDFKTVASRIRKRRTVSKAIQKDMLC